MHVGKYSNQGYSSHESIRDRKLLLHRKELNKLKKNVDEKGKTLIPLSIYFKSIESIAGFQFSITGCLKNLMLKILKGNYPPVSNKYSYELRQLIQCLLKKIPEDRPSLNTILRKSFIQKVEAAMLQPKTLLHQPKPSIRVQRQTKKVQNVYNRKSSRWRRSSE